MAKRRRRRTGKRKIKKRVVIGIRSVIVLFLFVFLMLGIKSKIDEIIFQRELIEESSLEVSSPLNSHQYDWGALTWQGGSLLSYEDENYTSEQGIDVSVHQEWIDWHKVKNAGIDFAIIRAGYRGYQTGKVTPDSYFEYNIKTAKEAGLDVGIYFFSQALNAKEAREEAEYMIGLAEKYDISGPIAFDMEHNETGIDRIENLSREEKTECALTFSRHVEKAGYHPMIYASSMLFDTEFDLSCFADFDLWVADYDVFPKFPYTFSIWQYTSEGHVEGIEGNVDMNLRLRKKTDQTSASSTIVPRYSASA